MTIIVKVSCFPNEGTPEVIDGDPQAGDLVRITTTTGAVIYERYTPQAGRPVPAIPHWDAYDFKLRFTPDERVAVRAAGVSNAYVADFIDMLDTAAATGTRIHADDALVALGFYVLETMEVISGNRAAAILGAAT